MRLFYSTSKEPEYLRFVEVSDCLEEMEDVDDWDNVTIYEWTTYKQPWNHCTEHSFIFEPECSRLWCDDYTPRNGVNGICRHLQQSVTLSGREFLLNKNGQWKRKK